MHDLPIREGKSTISKKEMKRRLRMHFVEHHFNKNDDDEVMAELPQIIDENPCDVESDS